MTSLRLSWRASTLVAMLLVLTACSGNDSDGRSDAPTESFASPSASAPATVSLDGVPTLPIDWSYTDTGDAETPPVLAVRRYLAYDYAVLADPRRSAAEADRRGTSELIAGYDAVARGEKLEDLVSATRIEQRGPVLTGTVRLRVESPATSAGTTSVVVCDDTADVRFGDDTGSDERSEQLYASRYQVSDGDGGWKVDLVRAADDAAQTRCDQWPANSTS